jgi:hypothetical protein
LLESLNATVTKYGFVDPIDRIESYWAIDLSSAPMAWQISLDLIGDKLKTIKNTKILGMIQDELLELSGSAFVSIESSSAPVFVTTDASSNAWLQGKAQLKLDSMFPQSDPEGWYKELPRVYLFPVQYSLNFKNIVGLEYGSSQLFLKDKKMEERNPSDLGVGDYGSARRAKKSRFVFGTIFPEHLLPFLNSTKFTDVLQPKFVVRVFEKDWLKADEMGESQRPEINSTTLRATANDPMLMFASLIAVLPQNSKSVERFLRKILTSETSFQGYEEYVFLGQKSAVFPTGFKGFRLSDYVSTFHLIMKKKSETNGISFHDYSLSIPRNELIEMNPIDRTEVYLLEYANFIGENASPFSNLDQAYSVLITKLKTVESNKEKEEEIKEFILDSSETILPMLNASSKGLADFVRSRYDRIK